MRSKHGRSNGVRSLVGEEIQAATCSTRRLNARSVSLRPWLELYRLFQVGAPVVVPVRENSLPGDRHELARNRCPTM